MMMEEEIERTREEIRKVEEACEKVEEVLERVVHGADLPTDADAIEEGQMEDVVLATMEGEEKVVEGKEILWFEDEKLLAAWNG